MRINADDTSWLTQRLEPSDGSWLVRQLREINGARDLITGMRDERPNITGKII